MAEKSAIEWTDASWNPTTGCTKVSQGCKNCYAEKLALRLQRMHSKKYANGFKLTLHEDALKLPLKWKDSKKIFVNSMSDLFHKDVPFSFIDKVWETMMEADWHIYQILTKRPERMLEYLLDRGHEPAYHIWLGTSVEDERVKQRIDFLRKVPAYIKFLSLEPLIGDVGKLNLKGIQWAIIGGESGKNHRPIQQEWILNIFRQCREQNVAFFFKQWGGITAKSGGRTLLGRTYSEYPKIKSIIQDKCLEKVYIPIQKPLAYG
ncbi:MAG TPA: phage Gp37/Gp68 family protein [Candidatus Nanoarchaeia archaeon]|nr:phage Gp37/Gp68 family protein [Candidatus Nanoarchaeia archaeon]